MKHVLLVAPLAAALSACASEDLDAFANGVSQFAYELDNQMNPPCPAGMYRQFVADTLGTSYPQHPYKQAGYQLTPGGYSYCAVPIAAYSRDDHHGRHGGQGRKDDAYADGYRDGHQDGRRDD